jgi:hypothetical protein
VEILCEKRFVPGTIVSLTKANTRFEQVLSFVLMSLQFEVARCEWVLHPNIKSMCEAEFSLKPILSVTLICGSVDSMSWKWSVSRNPNAWLETNTRTQSDPRRAVISSQSEAVDELLSRPNIRCRISKEDYRSREMENCVSFHAHVI